MGDGGEGEGGLAARAEVASACEEAVDGASVATRPTQPLELAEATLT